MEMHEGTDVLPETKVKRSETNYVILFHDQDGLLRKKEVKSWGDVKKESNKLPEGCVVEEVLRVTAKYKPQTKMVVEF